MRVDRRVIGVVVAAALAFAMGSCGGDDGGTDTAGDTPADVAEGGADADADADADAAADGDDDASGADGDVPGEDAADVPPEGTYSCLVVNICLDCCPPDDEACVAACTAEGTPDAQTQVAALYGCADSECATECGSEGTTEACNDCVEDRCDTELDSCDAGAVGRFGCNTLMGCLRTCGELPAAGSGTAETCPEDAAIGCYNGCFVASDENGVDLFFALNDCAASLCATECTTGTATECQTCVMTNCGTEATACVSDG